MVCVCGSCRDGVVVTAEQWKSIRVGLRFGQRLLGRVVHVPRPSSIGVFVDVGLPVGGFMDVLPLPRDATLRLLKALSAQLKRHARIRARFR